jgi:hypothetical protein
VEWETLINPFDVVTVVDHSDIATIHWSMERGEV